MTLLIVGCACFFSAGMSATLIIYDATHKYPWGMSAIITLTACVFGAANIAAAIGKIGVCK